MGRRHFQGRDWSRYWTERQASRDRTFCLAKKAFGVESYRMQC